MKNTFSFGVIIPYLIWYFVGVITVYLISYIYPIIPVFFENIFLFVPVNFILLWEIVRVPMEKKNDIEFIKYKNIFIFFSSLIYCLFFFFSAFNLLFTLIAHIILSILVIQLKQITNDEKLNENIVEYFQNKEKK